jgi:hypothetical protein
MTKLGFVEQADFSRQIDELDIFMATRIKRDVYSHEIKLYRTKWFDYRFLHPVQATMKYAEAYIPVFRRIYGSTFDSKAAHYIRVLKGNFFDAPKPTMSGLWRGRQIADAIGMPYEEFIDAAMSQTLRHWKKDFMPQPYHLYSTDTVEKVVPHWEELQKARLYFSEQPEFLTENYRNAHHQNDHHEWLLRQLAARPDPSRLLGRFVIEKRLLPIEKAAARFGEDSVAHLRSNA